MGKREILYVGIEGFFCDIVSDDTIGLVGML